MKLLIFGDSIARGAFDNERGGWAERLKTFFMGNHKKYGIEIYNLSVSSNDSVGVSKFIENDILKIKSIEDDEFAICIAIGTNDPRRLSKEGSKVIEIEEFKSNILQIITLANRYSANVFFVGGFPIDEEKVNPWCGIEYYYNKDLQLYEEEIELITGMKKIPFIKVWNNIELDELFDGLHPNSAGHSKIYEKVKEYILTYLI